VLGIHDFGVFLAAALLLNLTPGQDTVYIVGRAAMHGRRIGIAAALGVCSGALIHAVAAAFGLSLILATSQTAYALIKWIGALYLAYLGVVLILARDARSPPRASIGDMSAHHAFRQGVFTNLTNPKVALFFLAFLPQFVAPASPHKTAALLLLGLTFVATSTVWCSVLAWIAAGAAGRIDTRSKLATWLSRIVGAALIALGVRLALSER